MVPDLYNYVRIDILGTSLVVQWLRFHSSSAGDASSIPGWGTKIRYAPMYGQKKKKKEKNCYIIMQIMLNFLKLLMLFKDLRLYAPTGSL